MRPDNSELQGTDLAKQHVIDNFQQRLRSWVELKPGLVSIVKIGAHNGVTDDWVGEVMLEKPERWGGVMVEPHPVFLYERFQHFGFTRFNHITAGIGKSQGIEQFYFVDATLLPKNVEPLPEFHSQIGSFDVSHVEKHLSVAQRVCIRSVPVPVFRPETIWPYTPKETLYDPIDVLHIDVEGRDFEVFNHCPLSWDCLATLPKFIIVEHEHMTPMQENTFLSLISDAGYQYEKTFLDYIAFHPHLRIIEEWEKQKNRNHETRTKLQ